MIRVLIVDDHAVVRAGLERLLSSVDDFHVVGSAADGEQAVAAALEHRPDVVLMDLSMPVLDGIEATRLIRAELPSARVIVLTSSPDEHDVRAAIDAGADAYLMKDSPLPELEATILGPAPRPVAARQTLNPAMVAA
jgi:DNA-binding NarL/FixJ family response regulator